MWHASQNYGDTHPIFLNHPTEPHDFANQDKYRLDPSDTSKIGFVVSWSIVGRTLPGTRGSAAGAARRSP